MVPRRTIPARPSTKNPVSLGNHVSWVDSVERVLFGIEIHSLILIAGLVIHEQMYFLPGVPESRDRDPILEGAALC